MVHGRSTWHVCTWTSSTTLVNETRGLIEDQGTVLSALPRRWSGVRSSPWVQPRVAREFAHVGKSLHRRQFVLHRVSADPTLGSTAAST